jgi:hypothetical protein
MSAKGKCIYPNLECTPKIKVCLKYFAMNFIHLIHKACQILSTFTNQCHCHQTSQSLLSTSSHSLPTFLSSSLPFHNISPSVPSTALDIQHFLKPFRITSGEMHFHAVMIQIGWIIHVYFLVYNYLNLWSFRIFSTDVVSVKNLNMFVPHFNVVSLVW